MALTRKLLKSLGLEEAAIDTIIDAHTETTDALKKERDTAKADAEKATDLTRQLGEAKDKLAKAGDAAKVQADFDAYKQEVEAEKKAAKTDADVLSIVKEAGVMREVFQKAACALFDRSRIIYGEDGTITNRDELVKAAEVEFSDFAASKASVGVPPVNAPSGSKSAGMTKEQIMAIKDPAARQAAIARNPEAFGLVFSR